MKRGKKAKTLLQRYGIPAHILTESKPGFVASSKEEFYRISEELGKANQGAILSDSTLSKEIIREITERSDELRSIGKASWHSGKLPPKIYFLDDVVYEWDIEDLKKCIKQGRALGIFYIFHAPRKTREISDLFRQQYGIC